MPKLNQNQFYCVGCRSVCTCKKEDIGFKLYTNRRTKNKVPTLKCNCSKCGTVLTKFIKHKDQEKLLLKYGKW